MRKPTGRRHRKATREARASARHLLQVSVASFAIASLALDDATAQQHDLKVKIGAATARGALVETERWLTPRPRRTPRTYRHIRLPEGNVKWGDPRRGAGATVRFAVLTEPARFAGARNCPRLLPIIGYETRLGVSAPAFDRALRRAVAAWEAVADIRFERVAKADAAHILIGLQQRPRGRAYANVSTSLHDRPPAIRTRKPPTKPAAEKLPPGKNQPPVVRLTRALVCLNPTAAWKVGFDGDLDRYDLRYTLIHELGHAIGLDHPRDRGQLMHFRYSEAFRGLQPGDIAGVRALYGPAKRTRQTAVQRETPAPLDRR
ncbi:MAG: matrixin family metalloprotease [Pseudomonadota bacterium]